VSLLGTFAESEKELPQGSKLEVKLVLSPERHVKCKGTVIRCEPFGTDVVQRRYLLAIFFSEFTAKEEKRLTQFINQVISEEKVAMGEWLRKRKEKMAEKRKKRMKTEKKTSQKKRLKEAQQKTKKKRRLKR
jgi:hypothetical protein